MQVFVTYNGETYEAECDVYYDPISGECEININEIQPPPISFEDEEEILLLFEQQAGVLKDRALEEFELEE